MLRLIQTADWQLGKPYGRFDSEVRAALSEARFDAIDAIGKAAVDADVRMSGVIIVIHLALVGEYRSCAAASNCTSLYLNHLRRSVWRPSQVLIDL